MLCVAVCIGKAAVAELFDTATMWWDTVIIWQVRCDVTLAMCIMQGRPMPSLSVLGHSSSTASYSAEHAQQPRALSMLGHHDRAYGASMLSAMYSFGPPKHTYETIMSSAVQLCFALCHLRFIFCWHLQCIGLYVVVACCCSWHSNHNLPALEAHCVFEGPSRLQPA